jgi:hypothetical protein
MPGARSLAGNAASRTLADAAPPVASRVGFRAISSAGSCRVAGAPSAGPPLAQGGRRSLHDTGTHASLAVGGGAAPFACERRWRSCLSAEAGSGAPSDCGFAQVLVKKRRPVLAQLRRVRALERRNGAVAESPNVSAGLAIASNTSRTDGVALRRARSGAARQRA